MFSIKNDKNITYSTSNLADNYLKDLKKFYGDNFLISTVSYPDPDDASNTLEEGQVFLKNSQLFINKVSEVMDNVENPNLYQISILANGAGGSTSGGICFKEATSDALCSIIGYDDGTSARMGLSFNTGSAGGIGEAMNITADKNVGIGTSEPSCKLDVNGDVKLGNSVEEGQVFVRNSQLFIDKPSEVMNNISNHNLYQISILANGAGGSTSGGLCFKEANSDALCSIIGYDDGGDARMGLSFNTGLENSISEAMNINSFQNVGIGTNEPSCKLDVNGDVKIGGIRNSYKVVDTSSTTSYNVKNTDNVILCIDGGNGSLTLNLPQVNADINGKTIEFKQIDDTVAFNVTINSNGSQLIDGSTDPLEINTTYGKYKLMAIVDSSYTGWVILN